MYLINDCKFKILVDLDDLRLSIENETLMTFGDDTLLSPTGMPPTPLIPGEPIVEEKKKRRRNVVGLGTFCHYIFMFLYQWWM